MLSKHIPAIPLTIMSALGPILADAAPVGSRITCNPPPQDTDEDWLVLVYSDPEAALLEAGFTQDGSPEFYTGNDDGGFRSWRRDELNLVTTNEIQFYDRFMTATMLAKRFNLMDKGDRIALFQAVLYGVRVPNLEPTNWAEAPLSAFIAG
jgi:hypothetical protein